MTTKKSSKTTHSKQVKKSKRLKGLKSIKEVPPYDRPRAKMVEKDAKALSNTELMAALLGSGIKDKDVFQVAGEIIEMTEKSFSSLSLKKLQTINGVGMAKSCQIMAAIEFSRRFLIKEGIRIKTDRDVLNLVTDLAEKKQEYFLTLTLDGDNVLIRKRTVFIGTLNQSLVHPREVFADAISDRAAAIILVHNHPSGNCEPSREDYNVTDRLLEAGNIMGISVMDHIIVGKNNYFSFRKNGYIRERG